jgi:hypothetical protein
LKVTAFDPEGKDKSIRDFVSALVKKPLEWAVSDRWGGDERAIGLISPPNQNRLAYICSYNQSPGKYYVELEDEGSDPEDVYRVVGSRDACPLNRALSMVVHHLAPQAQAGASLDSA